MEVVVREVAPRLLRYCLGRTGDQALAEDVAQEALIVLVRRWRRVGPPESPIAFVLAIARRRVGRRVAKRRLRALFMSSQNGGDQILSQPPDLLGRDELTRTLRAIKQLRRSDREALLLVAAADLTVQEGATLLGISVPAVKMRVHRARQRLKAVLDGEEVG